MQISVFGFSKETANTITTLSQSVLMYASLLNYDILDKKTLEDQDVPQPNFYYWLATDVPTDFWNNFLSSCNMIVWIKTKVHS